MIRTKLETGKYNPVNKISGKFKLCKNCLEKMRASRNKLDMANRKKNIEHYREYQRLYRQHYRHKKKCESVSK